MNVFDLYASLSLNTDNYNSGLSDARNAAENFGQEIGEALEAGAKAYTELVKNSVEAYSNYEETADGIRLIFGETGESIIKNSKNAYKNAQMAASDYLGYAQVLSGALLRTLGDDTEAVTDLIDMALRDASDNVNAMGSDLNFVMTAYKGFARQEFRMLDNLYLGYGGTKTEARKMLYAMAEEKELLEQLGIEFSDLPEIDDFDKSKDFTMLTLDNIIKAIHVRQVQMHMEGTTLREGATHIQGTIRQTQAAWEDLKKTFAGEQDLGMDEAIQHLYDSIFGEEGTNGGLLNVIVPRISQTMEGISKFIVKAAPILADTIPQVIEELKPSFESAVNSVGELITTVLPSVVDLLWPVVSDTMGTMLDLVTGKMHESGGIFDLIADVVDFVRQHAEDIPGMLATMWASITSLAIAQDIMEFINLLRSTFNTATLVVAAIGAIIAVLYMYRGELAQFFSQLGNLFEYLRLAFENIRLYLENLDLGAAAFYLGTQIILAIINGINSGIGMISDALNNVISEINIDLPFFKWSGADWLASMNEGKGFQLGEIPTEGLEEKAAEYRDMMFRGRSKEIEDQRKANIERQNELRDEMAGSWWGVGDERGFGERGSSLWSDLFGAIGFKPNLFGEGGLLSGISDTNLLEEAKIPEEVPESYNGLTEAVVRTTNAITGGEDAEGVGLNPGLDSTTEKLTDIVTGGEETAAFLSDALPTAVNTLTNAIAGEGEGEEGTNLNSSLEATSAMMDDVVASGEPVDTSFSETLPDAANKLISILTGDSDQTVESSLTTINEKLVEIYNNTQNIINIWNGALASAIKSLEKNAETAVSALNGIGDAAAAAAGGFGSLSGAIEGVIASIDRLNGMKIQLPTLSDITGTQNGLDMLSGGGGIPGRASGGPVNAGDLYWVGEEGPELYVPERTGTIVNNDALSKLGQTINVYVHFEGDVIGDEESISGYVTKACDNAIKEAVYAGA